MEIDLSGLSMGDYAYLLLWLFLIYSFAGVLIETFYCWAAEHRGIIESRVGILYLSLNPLYGIGGVAVTVILIPYIVNPFLVFIIGLVVCTTLEFIASLVMERLFKSVFWDYSDKVLNVQGRICLQYAIIWGILSLVLIYVLNVINLNVIVRFARPVADVVLLVLSVLVAASIVLTLLAYARTEQKNAYLRSIQAGTDATLPDSWWGRVVDRLVPDSILINSFPRMSIITEYQELSNQPRKVWRLDLHLGRPSALRAEARERHDRVHAAQIETSP